ncbi:MAG: hypothetical protein WC437_00690 [Patescibacteria group bacterium]
MKSIYLLAGFTIVLIIVIFSILYFQGQNIKKDDNQVKPTVINDYANSSATVSYMAEGEVNADELHRSIKITVSKDSRTIEILAGFQYIAINSKSYRNTVEAYEPFLASLQVAGFAKEKSNPKISNPEGRCPLGNKYFFTSTSIPNIPNNLWTANCSGMGTFGGNLSTIQQLFQKQIPDYSKITSGVTL